MKQQKPTLTVNQMAALRSCANYYGRIWKSCLREMWMSGVYNADLDSQALQQIRNTFGPSWLVRFRFPETYPKPMTRQAAALHAVQAFSLTPWGEAITGPDLLEQNIADLLADIAHLCDREKLSLPAIIARAQMHYEAENTTGTQFIL